MLKKFGLGLAGIGAFLGMAAPSFAAVSPTTYPMDTDVSTATSNLVGSLATGGLTQFGVVIAAVAVVVVSIALAYWTIRHARGFLHI